MMISGRVWLMSVVVSLIALAACNATPDSKALLEAKPEAFPSRLSPIAAKRLSAKVPRSVVLKSLLANIETKALIAEQASRHGVSESQLGTLATKPLPSSASREVGAIATALAGDEKAYRGIDWTTGVSVRPSGCPTYGSSRWNVGALTVRNVLHRSWQPDHLVIPTQRNESVSQAIICYLEMPAEPALYMLAVRLARSDGQSFDRWVTETDTGNRTALMAAWWDAEPRGWKPGTFVTLTALPDGQGFAGLVNVSPSGQVNVPGMGMRRTTSKLEVSLHPSVPIRTTEYLEDLVFGGIEVTRL